MSIWKPSTDWRKRHTSQDLCYAVTFVVDPADALDRIWTAAQEHAFLDEDGKLLLGGAGIARAGDRHLVVTSGGEDALDSLESAVDDVLAPAVESVDGATVTAVREVRELVLDDESDDDEREDGGA